MGLRTLRYVVRSVTVTWLRLLWLIALCAEWLRLCEPLGSRIERLRGQHRRIHERRLVIRLHGSIVGLHSRELLVEEHVPHSVLGRDVVVQLAVEEPRRRLQVGIQSLILCRQVIVFFFVHLFINDILLGDAQRTTCPLLVDLRSSAGRLYTGLQAAVTATRCSNVSTAVASASSHNMSDAQGVEITYRSWFSS
jgi:hypothetical protein